jgi:hypothetical protein
MFWLTAVSDDAQAVVVEISESVGAALDEFHFAVEALGDGVVFGKTPHGDQGRLPVLKSFTQAHEGGKGALDEFIDQAQEAGDELATGSCGLVFEPKQVPEFDHFLIDGNQRGMVGQEFFQSSELGWVESRGMAPQHGEVAAVVADLGNDLPDQIHKVMEQDANDVEPVGHDAGVGEPVAHQGAVGAREVNADDPHLFPALEGG